MDSKRFDNWTRNRAVRVSRRDALKAFGVTGAAAALSHGRLDATAQGACSLTIHAETGGGPSAPAAYDGVLEFTLAADGELSAATFTPTGGNARPVTGVATGRSLDFEIDLGGGEVLRFSGSGTQPIGECDGAAGGLFSGPQPGDLGGWQTSGGSSTPPPGSQPSAPPACPPGQTFCGGACVTSCPAGQSLDSVTCQCVAGCTQDQGSCQSSASCCSGFCDPGSGTCQTCQFLACEGVGCVDPSFDPNNCGACGKVCSAPTATCTDGACTCQVDGLPCTKHFDCCSDSCAGGICGCIPVGGACTDFEGNCCGRDSGATACVSGVCRYLDAAHACFEDNECITGICKNGACASCLDPLEGPCTRDAECCNYNGLGCVNGVCPQ